MAIETISIQAYKSLYEVSLRPGALQVLVGPNNAGKSNLVEALSFLADVHQNGLEMAVRRAGGYSNIAFRRMRRTRKRVAFDVTAIVAVEDPQRFYDTQTRRRLSRAGSEVSVRIRHRFEIAAASESIRADYSVHTELLELSFATKSAQPTLFDEAPVALRLKREGSQLDIHAARPIDLPERAWAMLVGPLEEQRFRSSMSRYLTATELALTRIPWIEPYAVYSAMLARTRLFQLAPVELRRPGIPTPNADIERHGGNLPALVDFMVRNYPVQWNDVVEEMRRIVPGLMDVRTAPSGDRSLTLLFEEEGVRTPWTPLEISDGTIQSLALFCTLNDPRTNMVMIEEPENSVHPWILRNFIDACRRAGKQLILTTHSPALIDYLDPAEMALVWRRSGRTHVARLTDVDPEVQEIWSSGKVTLFEILDGGGLPEAVPEEPD